MKKIFFLVLLFILSSCAISKELKEERISWDYNNWDKKYKERALSLCIMKGYENKSIEKMLKNNDKSLYDPLAIAIFDKSLKPIINDELKKIKQDSINSIGSYPDDLKTIYQKRNVLGNCIDFYNSKKLDSITKKESEKWKKITNILDEIHKEIPTY
ncbi:MAG: hypothetical protein ACK40Y_09930 [Cloacibacterium caeni]